MTESQRQRDIDNIKNWTPEQTAKAFISVTTYLNRMQKRVADLEKQNKNLSKQNVNLNKRVTELEELDSGSPTRYTPEAMEGTHLDWELATMLR